MKIPPFTNPLSPVAHRALPFASSAARPPLHITMVSAPAAAIRLDPPMGSTSNHSLLPSQVCAYQSSHAPPVKQPPTDARAVASQDRVGCRIRRWRFRAARRTDGSHRSAMLLAVSRLSPFAQPHDACESLLAVPPNLIFPWILAWCLCHRL